MDDEQRFDFIIEIIQETYKLNVLSISQILAVEDHISPNNFIYLVEFFRTPHTSLDTPASQPGTVRIPNSVNNVIMSLSNPDKDFYPPNRVQNEVAAMSLARTILAPRKVIPDVYGWGSDAEEKGWIMMENRMENITGIPLVIELDKLGLRGQTRALQEVARVVLAFQQYELPESVQWFGGLDFDDDGNIVSAPLTLFSCGPFTTYPEMLKCIFRERLAAAEESHLLRGWKDTGRDTLAKLEDFITVGIDYMLKDIKIEKRLVHGNLALDNFMYDRKLGQISAILGFDSARISAIADEMLTSFDARFARLPMSHEGDLEIVRFRRALLHGFPREMYALYEKFRWEIALAWESLLEAVGAQRPRTLKGIERFSSLYMLLYVICPEGFEDEMIVDQDDLDKKQKEKEYFEEIIQRLLP
ncbi:hypothetical protein DSL72_008132 [Monilinia vaccinii-corymbosi]|uniref:Aminoglycoside phosphotransferase domain-containing protein n=1 Tax=Monilinia vaccinii-corymbosi TaxID=61207 RepID=A0A8A3PJS3_9HELO|nr:hypothetical protein DSL72_008132 [Monilinia vaccinii-corymbosi]